MTRLANDPNDPANANADRQRPLEPGFRQRAFDVVFEADTFGGKLFDVALLVAIAASVILVMLESVEEVREKHEQALEAAEWALTVVFTLEYVLRLCIVRSPWRYATSFFGIVDLLAVLPSYVGLAFGDRARPLMVIRALRLLRAFRVFRMGKMTREAEVLRAALWQSRHKIFVFLSAVLCTVVILGASMHLVEGEASGFDSIPTGCYWAIVTMTTVGYGDIAPVTVVGKFLASVIMVLGYGFIVVPTGIVSAEFAQAGRPPSDAAASVAPSSCGQCRATGHTADAHCRVCGGALTPGKETRWRSARGV